jgi:hypothetical protein
MEQAPVLSADAVRAAARAARFSLVGLARAEALDPRPLQSWLASGYAADMTWMARRLPERLDPTTSRLRTTAPPARPARSPATRAAATTTTSTATG